MSFDFENIHTVYDNLVSGSSDPGEVYAGETSQSMAAEKGIHESKWMNDCVSMQIGQEIMDKEIKKGIPLTHEEQESRVRELINQLISARLRSQANDLARKGLLLQAISAADAMSEEALAQHSHLNLKTLQNELAEITYSYTINHVLPAIQHQCNLLKIEPVQQKTIIDNAGALAVAEYLEHPEVQDIPEVIGSSAALASHYSTDSSSADIVSAVAYGLLIIAGIIAFLALLSFSATVLSSAVTTVLVDGSFAAVGTAVASDIALSSGFVVGMLKIALGTSVLSGLVDLLAKVIEWGENSKYINHSTSGHIISV